MAVLTVNSDAGTGGTKVVDGHARRETVDQTFANIRAGAGNNSSDTDTSGYAYLSGSATTGQFDRLVRSILLFDTSALPDNATIDSAVLNLYITGKDATLGETSLEVCASTPANTNAIVNADYGQLGTASFASVAYGNVPATGALAITLNAAGIAAISKTGITKLGLRLGWDLTGTFGGTWGSSKIADFVFYEADQTGANIPSLVITYHIEYTLAVDVASFTLTGQAITFSKGWAALVVGVANYVLTWKSVIFKVFKVWQYLTKHSSSYTEKTKNTASYSEKTKNTASYSYKDKN